MNTGHAPTELIADYTSGSLSCGMSLLVASHLTFCPACRDRAARLEALGGALLAEADTVAPTPRCLKGALDRIACREISGHSAERSGPPLPRPLCRRLGTPISEIAWRQVLPGLATYQISGFAVERVGLVRADPGVPLCAEGRSAGEAALVLAGQLQDGGQTYHRGELAFAEDGSELPPHAVGEERCLCLVVEPLPSQSRNPS